MTDPYYPYPTPAPSDGASFARSSYAGYIPSEAPSLASPLPKSTDFPGYGSDYLNKDVSLFRMEPYGVDDTRGSRVHSEHNVTSYNPLEDVDLSTKRDALLGVSTGVPDPIANNERSISKSNYDALPVSAAESNILFVGGLPKDCTRREVGHLFRPFIGYKDIKVVHKEPRRSGDKAMIFCFVEFTEPKCALTAMEALQGYKFDDKKPDSPTLKIKFAHFPFRPPTDDGQ